jgi:hypothetical protein
VTELAEKHVSTALIARFLGTEPPEDQWRKEVEGLSPEEKIDYYRYHRQRAAYLSEQIEGR